MAVGLVYDKADCSVVKMVVATVASRDFDSVVEKDRL